MTIGYWNLPEESARTLRGGWLHTGDMGRFDEDGYVYIVDRRHDMIVSGGKNIYPREIEEVIYGLERDYWGKGLGNELLTGLVRWARDTLQLPELRATVAMQNVASIALLGKHGFALRDDCYDGEPDTRLYVLGLGDD